jgi:aminoglycoside phosphotransferase (APT) family kinase protein
MHDRRSGAITGVIDWGSSTRHAPPLEDLLNLLCTRKELLSRYHHGAYLIRVWNGSVSSRDRARVAAYFRGMNIEPALLRPLSVLFWIRFLVKWQSFADTGWYRRAVRPVESFLGDALDRDGLAGGWLDRS